MKVKELIAELKQLDPEKEVLLSQDAEGNCFHGVAGTSGNDGPRIIIWSDDEYHEIEYTDGGE